MRAGWPVVTVEGIAAPQRNALVGGPFGSNLVSSDYVASGVPVIRGQNMANSRWVCGEFAFVSSQKADSLAANLARPGDLVFTQRGTLGQVAIVPKGSYGTYVVSQSQMKLTPDSSKADVLFLYYLFKTPDQQRHIVNSAIQTGVPHTNLTILKQTKLALPPLREQQTIARLLGILDDKIECNRRMNETLEAIARTIFKSWFIDFDFVRAPAEFGSADLFPQDLEPHSGFPLGWKFVRLSDVCSTQYGFTASATDQGTGPKLLRVTDINKADWIDWTSVPNCEIGEAERERYQLHFGDIVVARMADPGKAALITDEVPAVFASYLVRLKTASLAQAFYIYQFLKSDLYREYAEGARSGSVQANMNAQVIVGAYLVWPSQAVLERFRETVEPLRNKIASNLRESAALANLRDALLPKLLSGQIRLNDAEKTVRAAI